MVTHHSSHRTRASFFSVCQCDITVLPSFIFFSKEFTIVFRNFVNSLDKTINHRLIAMLEPWLTDQGNIRHFPLRSFVVTPAQFVEMLRESKPE